MLGFEKKILENLITLSLILIWIFKDKTSFKILLNSRELFVSIIK